MADDRIDTTVAHPARRYDYWLGGKDNFQADRDSVDAVAAFCVRKAPARTASPRAERSWVTDLTNQAIGLWDATPTDVTAVSSTVSGQACIVRAACRACRDPDAYHCDDCPARSSRVT